MSYRDLRNFTETMRTLSYPRHISMDNFRNPNFKLVAEILSWLVKRYDPDSEIPVDIETAQDRVFFITQVAQFMATKAHVKLSTKKLYQADGYAVKELLKATGPLYNAVRNQGVDLSTADDEDTSAANFFQFDVSSKLSDLKEVRKLASEITSKGAKLHELIQKEPDLREARDNVLTRNLEIDNVEKTVQSCSKQVETDIKKIQMMLDNVASDEQNLEAKIEKKQNELERNQKRLSTLQAVRPAYMDDFERYEEELEELYGEYVRKFRNLAFIEKQIDDYNKHEASKMKEAEEELRKMAEKLMRDDPRFGGEDMSDNMDDLIDSDDGRDAGGRRANGRNQEDEGLDENSLSVDDDDDQDDLDDDDDDEEDDEMVQGGPMAAGRPGGLRQPTGAQEFGNGDLSDDENF